jgi:hypothetical protein
MKRDALAAFIALVVAIVVYVRAPSNACNWQTIAVIAFLVTASISATCAFYVLADLAERVAFHRITISATQNCMRISTTAIAPKISMCRCARSRSCIRPALNPAANVSAMRSRVAWEI